MQGQLHRPAPAAAGPGGKHRYCPSRRTGQHQPAFRAVPVSCRANNSTGFVIGCSALSCGLSHKYLALPSPPNQRWPAASQPVQAPVVIRRRKPARKGTARAASCSPAAPAQTGFDPPQGKRGRAALPHGRPQGTASCWTRRTRCKNAAPGISAPRAAVSASVRTPEPVRGQVVVCDRQMLGVPPW